MNIQFSMKGKYLYVHNASFPPDTLTGYQWDCKNGVYKIYCDSPYTMLYFLKRIQVIDLYSPIDEDGNITTDMGDF